MQTEMKNRTSKGFGTGLGIAAGFLVVGLLARNAGLGMRQRIHRLKGGITVSGGIMGIQTAGMAADLTKQPGQDVTVSVTFNVSTKDFKGVQVIWPYRVQAWLLNSAGGTISTVCDPVSCGTKLLLSNAQQTTLTLPVPSNIPAPGTYIVNVQLWSVESDANGVATTIPLFLDGRDALDKIVVPQQVGPAVPGGSIGSIILSQRRGLRGRR